MHLLLTGGGTAGHIMPNLALIESLRKLNPTIQISYIGSSTGLEVKLLQSEAVDFYTIPTGKLRRYFSIQNFTDFFKVIAGFFKSLYLLKKIKPTLLFSKGGYVALPVVFAAWCFRVPIIIHESDAIPGLTTKITAKFATQIWGGSTNLQKYFPPQKYKTVYLPIRSFLTNGNKQYFNDKLQLDPQLPTLLVMGGSLGAGGINHFISANLPILTTQFNLIHICGKGKLSAVNDNPANYYQVEYLDAEMANAYAIADFVLSRSGASAISELSFLRKKSILVPLPKTQSRGEQLVNANEMAATGLAKVINETDLNLESFHQAITDLSNPNLVIKDPAGINFDPSQILNFE